MWTVPIGTPSEQIGFQATEEYASRMSSPRPQSSYHVAHSNTSQAHVDSPLRKESNTTEGAGKEEFEKTLSRSLQTPSDTALQSETEDEDTIHVDEPERRKNKIYGGTSRFESTEYLEPYSEEEEHNEEHGYSAPILASDEVAKEPFGWELQPAVSPSHERRGSSYDDGYYHQRSGSASSLAGSRPGSRPGSIHGPIPGLRVSDSTPLEDLDEYEPLFPEEERSGQAAMQKKPLTAADKLKRPDMKVCLSSNSSSYFTGLNYFLSSTRMRLTFLESQIPKPRHLGRYPQQSAIYRYSINSSIARGH
jgi:hypothetical protein